jgi:hypothetical protein
MRAREGSRPRPAAAGLFSEFKVSDDRMAELRLEVRTVFTARGDARPPGSET